MRINRSLFVLGCLHISQRPDAVLCRVQKGGEAPFSWILAETAGNEKPADQSGNIACGNCCPGNSGNAPFKLDHEQQVEADIQNIQCQRDDQIGAGILHPEQPAKEDIVGEGGRRTPYPYAEIDIGQLADILCGPDKGKCKGKDRALKQDHRQRYTGGNQQGPAQHGTQFIPVGFTECLGRKPAGCHLQEPESPEDIGEQHRPHGDRAKMLRANARPRLYRRPRAGVPTRWQASSAGR